MLDRCRFTFFPKKSYSTVFCNGKSFFCMKIKTFFAANWNTFCLSMYFLNNIDTLLFLSLDICKNYWHTFIAAVWMNLMWNLHFQLQFWATSKLKKKRKRIKLATWRATALTFIETFLSYWKRKLVCSPLTKNIYIPK